MKLKQLLTISALAVSSLASARVLTVSNNPAQPAQYDNLQAALNAAVAGDTLYLHGSNANYSGNLSNVDSLTIIGTGFNPQKTNPLTSKIFLGTGSSCNVGGHAVNFIGIVFPGTNSAPTVNLYNAFNFTFQRCKFDNYTTIYQNAQNIVFSECIFQSPYYDVFYIYQFDNIFNILFKNNVFFSPSNSGYGIIADYNGTSAGINPGIVFLNNVFTRATGSSYSDLYYSYTGKPINGIQFINNIFQDVNPMQNNLPGATFSNNLTTLNINLDYPTCTGCSGSDNIFDTPAEFLNAPPMTSYNTSFDFNLSPISIANNSGINGEDLGVMGGATPFQHDGEPFIPQIDHFQIMTPSINAGGIINIKIKATALE